MYFKSSRAFVSTAVAAGLALTALQANAQQVKFHLPFEAHWGAAVLEPGDYTLSVPVAELQPIFRVSGDRKSSMILPMEMETQHTSSGSFLQLVNVNGTYFVKEYKSGPTGKTFSFAVPKPVVETSIASAGTTEIAADSTK